MSKKILTAVFIVLLSACGGGRINLSGSTPSVLPSALPAILSPTPKIILSPTIPVSTTIAPTLPAITPMPPTATFTPAVSGKLLVEIIGCNTSLDILHQMGEVTNAFPILLNYTQKNLTNICATLSASDEARQHPDKIVCIANLPAENQVILKLTVDTGTGQDTSIQVDVGSNEGDAATAKQSSCRAIGIPGWLPGKVNIIEPIP